MTSRQGRLRSRISLRALPISLKLALTILVVLAVVGVLTNLIVGQVVRLTQTESTLAEMSAITRTQAVEFAETLSEELWLLQQLRSNPLIYQYVKDRYEMGEEGGEPGYDPMAPVDASVAQEMTFFWGRNTQFDSLVIVDAHRRVISADPIPSATNVLPEAWSWFDAAYAGGLGKVYISGPINDNLTGFQGVHLALPIYDRADRGIVLGVLYAVWNMNDMTNVVTSIAERELFILEPDGSFVFSSATQDMVMPLDVLTTFGEVPSGAFLYEAFDGSDWLYSYWKLRALSLTEQPEADVTDWIVVSRAPYTTTQATITLLQGRLQLAIGVSTATVTLAVALMSLILLHPMSLLTRSAEQILAGDLDAPIPELPPDEVGRLADVLRSMVEQLVLRVRQLGAAVRVVRESSATLDVEELIDRSLVSLVEQFQFTGGRLYMADMTGRQLRLQVARGDEAADLMAEGERIPLNEDSLVGRAMLLNEPQTGPVDVRLPSYGKVRRPSLALPLQAGGRIFGGVLLLAEVGRAFDPQTIDLLRLVIDQLASALENARLFEQSVANVAEIEALNRRLTREAWEEYIGDGESLRHTLDPQSQWPDDLEALRERAELVIETYEDSNGRSVLAAPLVSRGEPIGTLAVTRPAGETWTRDERLLFEAVASRLALMAENIRIVEEASLRAEHERRVNEVSAGLMQRTESVEGVLQAALNQLSSVLGSEHVSLRIGRPPGTDSSVAQGDGSGDSFPGNGG